MYFCDSHTHSKYSFDGTENIDAMCQAAIGKKINEIAITDHYDIDGIINGYYPPYFAERVYNEIIAAREKYKSKLVITHGIELGQAQLYPSEARAFIEKYQFEFIIGSIHNLKDVPDFSFIKYDSMPERLYEILWERSLNEILDMLDFEGIDTLAHLTYPVRYITKCGRKINLVKYHEAISNVYHKMIKKGICLEINTSGYRQGMGCSMPDDDLIKLYHECGGELITVGSDAHRNADLGADVETVYGKLLNFGFKTISVFHNGKLESVKL